MASPAFTLLNTKYDVRKNLTHDASFAGYIVLYIPIGPIENDTQQ